MMKFVIAAAAVALAGPAMAQCVGNCGVGSPNGVVTASPAGSAYRYVSTAGGVGGLGLGLGSETNGSQFTSPTFSAAVGDELSFFFNFVTSDGAGFADYAYVQLLGASSPLTLFTARTTPAGNTVPGFSMPAIAPGVALTPATVGIIGGAPAWDKLGSSSGTCWSSGCGYTGWIKMTYTIGTAGTYGLRFGVVNWGDTAFQTGLAYNGTVIGETPIGGVPEPATWAMLIAGFGMVGAASRRRRTAIAA